MLDQNTDRMWYVIGAIVIGAAIIAMGLNIYSDSFDSVDGLMASQLNNAEDLVGVITGENPTEWYSFNKVQGGYEITGFNQRYVDEEFDGVQPTVLHIPSEYRGEPVIKIMGGGSYLDPAFRNIRTITIPDSVIEIGAYAFAVDVDVSDRWYEDIPNDTWKDERTVRVLEGHLTIPDSVEIIGTNAFRGNNLTSIKISNSLKTIEAGVFHTNQLTEVDIPDSVVEIKSFAFENNNLKKVNYSKNLETIGGGAFNLNKLTEIDLPKSVTHIDGRAFTVNNVPYESAFIYGRHVDGSIDYSTLVSYAGSQTKNIVVPDTVVRIEGGAFLGSRIESLVLPEGLKYIERDAFRYNRLTSISFPESIVGVHPTAFQHNGPTGHSEQLSGAFKGSTWVIDNNVWVDL